MRDARERARAAVEQGDGRRAREEGTQISPWRRMINTANTPRRASYVRCVVTRWMPRIAGLDRVSVGIRYARGVGIS